MNYVLYIAFYNRIMYNVLRSGGKNHEKNR